MKHCTVFALAYATILGGCSGQTLSAGESSARDAGGPPEASTPPEAAATPTPLTPGSCSSLTWGTQVAPVSDGECASVALGRWKLCDAGADDAAAALLPPGVGPGSGIEFSLDDAGVLDFYVLVPGEEGALVRSQDLRQRGFVDQPSTWTSGACHYWVAPASMAGAEYGWTVERFEHPDALLVNGVVSYVPSP